MGDHEQKHVTTVKCGGGVEGGCALCIMIVNGTHHHAMELAQKAMMTRDSEAKAKLNREAYELERKAAEMVGSKQPTRCVLFYSAACLAKDAGLRDEALLMVEKGLAEDPVPAYQYDLENLKVSLEKR